MSNLPAPCTRYPLPGRRATLGVSCNSMIAPATDPQARACGRSESDNSTGTWCVGDLRAVITARLQFIHPNEGLSHSSCLICAARAGYRPQISRLGWMFLVSRCRPNAGHCNYPHLISPYPATGEQSFMPTYRLQISRMVSHTPQLMASNLPAGRGLQQAGR